MLLSKTILILLLASMAMLVFIQPANSHICEGEWSKIFDGGDLDCVNSVDQTIDGGYVFVGDTMSYGSGATDVWLVKTDQVGNLVWNKTFGTNEYDEGLSIQQTDDDGYIITGYRSLRGSGYKDSELWLIKTYANGEMEWNKTITKISNTTVQWGEGHSVRQTNDGGFIVAGTVQLSYYAIWLIKTDLSGNKVWERVFASVNMPSLVSVQQTADGGYIVAGNIQVIDTLSDILLIKTDTTGAILWNKTYNIMYGDIAGREYAYSVEQTSDGGYIVAGRSDGSYGTRGWVIKTDALGDKIWEITMEPETTTCAAQQTTDGGYIIFGTLYNMHGQADCIRLVKTDGDGKMLWEKLTDYWYVCGAQDGLQTNDGSYIIVADVRAGLAPSDVWLVHTSPLWEITFTELGGHPITDLAIYDETLYSASNNNIYVYNGSGWSVIDAPTFVISLEPYQDKLIVGGQGGLYSYNGSTFNLIFSVSTYIKPLGVYNNTLYAGTVLDSPPILYYCNGSAENPDNWFIDTDFSTTLNLSRQSCSIDSFAVYNDTMYVASGSTVYSLNGTDWSIVKTYEDVNAFLDMKVYTGKLYLATRDTGWRRPIYLGYSGFSGRVIEFDGVNWATLLDHNYWIFSLETYDSKLYAGTANKIFTYNGTHWETSFSSEEGTYYAISLITCDGEIYAGMGNGYIFVDPSPEIMQRETVMVPEFPSFIILQLLMLTILIALLIKRRKRVP